MIDKNGKPTTLQPGDILLFESRLRPRLWVVRPKDKSCLLMNDEDERLYLFWNNHPDKYRELMEIFHHLFNLDLQEVNSESKASTIKKIKNLIRDYLPTDVKEIKFAIEVIS